MWSADTGLNHIGLSNINCHFAAVVDVDCVLVQLITALMITTVCKFNALIHVSI